MNQEGIYFQTKRHILLIFTGLVVLGYVIDLFAIYNDIRSFWANIISIGVVFLSVILTYFSSLTIKQAFGTIVYSLIANIFLSYYFNIRLIEVIEAEVFRAALIIGMLLPIAGFVINKKHSLYIGGILLTFYVMILVISQNKYIANNFYLVVVIFTGYTLGVYYILYLFEDVANKQKKMIEELEEINNELIRTNILLSERNHFIDSQRVELKELNESRDRIFSVISHDIKNPLFAIISFCELTKEKLKSADYDKVFAYHKMIHLSANNLHSLIINLLDWTRLHSGKLFAKKELIDANFYIDETVKLFENSSNHKGVIIHVAKQLDIKLFADINMFNTILRNLLSNAIKFTPSGGIITVDSKVENSKYYCTISDSGVGMSSDDISSIMLGRNNLTSIGTNGESGTGLGLELCKEFIKLHEGELLINSDIGAGSKFTICLPTN